MLCERARARVCVCVCVSVCVNTFFICRYNLLCLLLNVVILSVCQSGHYRDYDLIIIQSSDLSL
jgi:hypothetical protein